MESINEIPEIPEIPEILEIPKIPEIPETGQAYLISEANVAPWWFNPRVPKDIPPPHPDIPPPHPEIPPSPRHQPLVMPSQRVDTTTNPWLPGEIHCPGLVARYTITIDSEVVNLQIQTWSGIYRAYKFLLKNLVHTELQVINGDCVINLVMKKTKPIVLMFEYLDQAEKAHDYLFDQLER